MKRANRVAPFHFSHWPGVVEPHVIIVSGRPDLLSNYNTDAVDIVDAHYGGGGWDKFLCRVSDVLKIYNPSEQVLLELIYSRALEKPLAIFVGNARALALDCAEELVRFSARWERFACDAQDTYSPMFLVLQMPQRR